jgi:hypothetical protein
MTLGTGDKEGCGHEKCKREERRGALNYHAANLILKLTDNAAQDNKHHIVPQNLQLAIGNDEECVLPETYLLFACFSYL